jgi:acyl-CoA thioesterase
MTAGASPTPFDTDTAVTLTAPGTYAAELAEHWNVILGPNGGYLAAVVARAMTEEVADPTRGLRSITVHYLRRPEFGPVSLDVEVLRTGRSLSSVSATMRQGDQPICTALAAFSVPWDSPVAWARTMPETARVDNSDPAWSPPTHIGNFDTELHVDAPLFSGEGSSRTAGWIRTVEPRPLDGIELVAISDALPPAIFPRVSDRMAVPTIDLTVHIRAALPHAGLAVDDRIYAEFTTDHVADGFIEEDGTMWAPDGTLLAQSRQLAIAR